LGVSCILLGGWGSTPARAGVTDEAVEVRIRELKEMLIGMQTADGSWAYQSADYRVGATALAILALKYAGLPNNHPAIVNGVSYIVENETSTVYTEGLVPCALELVDARQFVNRIWYSAKFLMEAQSSTGNWSYRGRSGSSYDNSNSQFAVLGLAAAERCGVLAGGKPARQFAEVRERAIRHWQNSQGKTGGWSYRDVGDNPTLSMTCAGIASLHLFGKRLEVPGNKCGQYTPNKHLQKGLACLAGLLGGGRRGFRGGGHWGGYGLYALERVGVFLDLRTIGDYDWYRQGASAILRSRTEESVVNAAFHLLFLAKGNAPVAIAKWRWDGDWHNDRGDAKAWVTWTGGELGKRFDSWECRLDDPAGTASKASLVYVNGHGRFRASERELAFLRRLLLKKGTVVAEACCGRKEFLDSFKEVMCKRLFPGQVARFEPIRPEHPVCSLVHDLDPKTVGALEFSVACRKPRMLLFTRDFSCALNGDKDKEASRDLARARKVATNLLAWALVTRKAGGKLARTDVESETPEEVATDQLERENSKEGWKSRFAMGRLVHRGDWNADADFFPNLRAAFEGQTAVPCFEREIAVAPTSDDLFHVPFVFVTGHDDPALRPNEYLNLRTYLQNGGFMFLGACCASDLYDAGARQLIRRVLPNDKLERVPPDDPIWRLPFDCRGGEGGPAAEAGPETTTAYRERFGEDWAPLFGIRREGRWALIYCPVDVCCDLHGDLAEDVAAYRAASAVKLIGNIVNCALSP
jgi:hypothetical protein